MYIHESIILFFLAVAHIAFIYSEIDQSSNGVIEDIEKCKDSALERKRTLEEDKERFQKAAYSVLDMLNNRESS